MGNEKVITVIGATGNLGAPVVKNLVNEGFRVTAIVRNSDKAEKIFGNNPSITIVKADLTNIEELRVALKGTAVLYLSLASGPADLTSPFAADREGVANIIEAIDRESIRQIITISGLGAFDNHVQPGKKPFIPNVIRKQGHRIIKDSGIPYTILHCSWFADSFVLYLRNEAYAVIGNTKDPIYFTNCYDYTRHIINSIGNSEAMFREFPIQGRMGIPHIEAAERFFSVYDPSVAVKPLPAWIISMIALFKKEMKFVKQMSDYFSDYSETLLADECDTFRILGEPVMSVEKYAAKLKDENFYSWINSSSTAG